MKILISLGSLGMLWCLVSGGPVLATTTSATFYYHGIDLETGAAIPDPSVVIVLHGQPGQPIQFFKPASYSPAFALPVDLYYEYDSTTGITLAFPPTQTGVTGMSLALQSVPFASVTAAMTASLVFDPPESIPLTTNPGPTIILRLANDVHLKLGNFAQSGFELQSEFEHLTPEINLKQGSANIPSGTGSYAFGTVNVGSNSVREFTIENTGVETLTLTGNPRVAVSVGDFSVTIQPPASVGPKASAAFTLRFAPTLAGPRTATVSIINNDSNETPYTFTVSGTGQANSYLLWTK